ncbi:MAG: phosphoheptose isomerase [Gloeobacteraceae cyanobacterium ES-bin-316]|nr:phosphoheptose isomerase [Ferruginibacter sp.]
MFISEFLNDHQKQDVFKEVEEYISSIVHISQKDMSRPWGGFLVIEEADAERFINEFFPNLSKEELSISGKLSPKILLVEPGKKLSWQYHHRRAEIWKLISGRAGVVKSDDDQEKDLLILAPGDLVELKKGERHRLIGLDKWGIIAEIWQHTDADNPSDEEDIVRLQDDFGR